MFQRQCISWGVGDTQELGVSAVIAPVPILYKQKHQGRSSVTTGDSSGCSSVCHNYLVLARAKCRGTQRMDSSAQALLKKLGKRSYLLYLLQSHQESNKSWTPILWSPQLNPQTGRNKQEGQRSPTRSTFPSGNQQGYLKPWQNILLSSRNSVHMFMMRKQLYMQLPVIFTSPHHLAMPTCENVQTTFLLSFHVFTRSLLRSFLTRQHLPTVFGVLSICEEQIWGIIKTP